MKNPDLCERPHCRERWTAFVGAYRRGRSWTLRVCEDHARVYRPVDASAWAGSVTVQPRKQETEA
jgi:hypothetical protein